MPRGRPVSVVPAKLLNVAIPGELFAQVEITLYSEVESRVPHGAYSKFFSARIREFFSWKTLDLAPFLGTPEATFVVSGEPEVLRALRAKLQGDIQ